MDLAHFMPAFWMAFFAGLATGIGGLVAFINHGKHVRGILLSLGLGFSGGLMIYVSLTELMVEAQALLKNHTSWGGWGALAAFAGGAGFAALLDLVVPEAENPHEARSVEEFSHAEVANPEERARLGRAGLLFALIIGIHNFPEGLATLIAGLDGTATGITIAVAIGLHNIPEGIAIAIPLCYATGNRKKAFGYSVLAGLAEPAGAVVGYLILYPFLGPVLMAILYAGVAGIMIYITFDEMLPMAARYGNHHIMMAGLVLGMLVMAASMLLLH